MCPSPARSSVQAFLTVPNSVISVGKGGRPPFPKKRSPGDVQAKEKKQASDDGKVSRRVNAILRQRGGVPVRREFCTWQPGPAPACGRQRVHQTAASCDITPRRCSLKNNCCNSLSRCFPRDDSSNSCVAILPAFSLIYVPLSRALVHKFNNLCPQKGSLLGLGRTRPLFLPTVSLIPHANLELVPSTKVRRILRKLLVLGDLSPVIGGERLMRLEGGALRTLGHQLMQGLCPSRRVAFLPNTLDVPQKAVEVLLERR